VFEYKIKIDKKIIAILGPHLYGDTASIIAELVANCYDADATDCWVTLRTGVSPEIVIEDNGVGMTPEEVNRYFLDIGYDRRTERALSPKGRRVFGRKGIGKLAAFSLAKRIELYSRKDGKKAGCILDYDKITLEGRDPEAIPEDKIEFEPGRLSEKRTGTRLILRSIQKNINTTYYYLINRIIRNFNVDFEEFRIHMIKNQESPKTISYTDLDFFGVMDTIVTIGSEYEGKLEAVQKNEVDAKYKMVARYEELLVNHGPRKSRLVGIPKGIQVVRKGGGTKEAEFVFQGWIGTVTDKEKLKGLVITAGASEEEQDSISVNDNRITVFSRDRIGEYDVLPKVQTDTIYDAYVIGEIHVDIFEDDELVDMAISNRRGYEETDERYRVLIDCLRPLVSYVAQRKAEVQRIRKRDENAQEAEEIKKGFLEKGRTREILEGKLDETELRIIQDDHFQFARATRLSESTKRILISHNGEHAQYGFFIMKMFGLLGVNIASDFIFTSCSETGVPHGQNIYDYLKSCFREDIYVIFLFSRHFYDSNICIAETGAAWATNRNHSNIIIDIGYADIDRPIDNAKQGFMIRDMDSLDRHDVVKFIKTVLTDTGFDVPPDDDICVAVEKAVDEFRDKLHPGLFCPRRKYQGHPLCGNPHCGNTMDLKADATGLYYECRTPGCDQKTRAEIY